jgi:hypothetical protein
MTKRTRTTYDNDETMHAFGVYNRRNKSEILIQETEGMITVSILDCTSPHTACLL